MLLTALLVSSPVLAVAGAAAAEGAPTLPGDVVAQILTTLGLVTMVALASGALGAALAWLVSAQEFPGRPVLEWLLVLPLAMPAYVLGFIFLSTFDYAGPVQSALRAVLGDGLPDLPTRSLVGAAVVLTLTLYPYVYLLARSAFADTAPTAYDAARSLGASRGRAFRQVVLPLARPALAAGLALVTMEVLTDFATVQYFGVETVSVGVYLTWKGSFDFGSAVWLAVIVLLFAVAVLAGERALRGKARFFQRGGRGRGITRRPLEGGRAWAASAACAAVVAAAFGLPLLRLLTWTAASLLDGSSQLLERGLPMYLANSLTVAGAVAVACVAISLVVSHALRLGGGRVLRAGAQATTFGYAVPGAVVGIGVLAVFAGADQTLIALGVEGGTGILITGSVAGVVLAYVVRFTAPAYQAVDSAFSRVPPSVSASAMTLGAGPRRLLTRVHLPLTRSGVAVALTLVLIDAIKELPLVLMLRPFGFSTLSVWVFELASENYWEQAAVPALIIVVVALVPVAITFARRRETRPERRGEAPGTLAP